MEEPLLDRDAARSSGAGEDGDHEMGKRMKNVVSSSREGNADPSSSDIGEQIRDMQNNFLVGMTRDGGGLEEDLRRRSEGLQPAEGTSGTSRTRMKRSQSIVSLARDGAQSVLESTKSRGTVALLSFHVCLTALWAILGAFYYMWRLDWSFDGAVYFMFQAGYGVGFGGPLVLNRGDNDRISIDVLYFTTVVVCLIGSLSVFSLYAFFFHEFQLHAFQSHLDKESKSAFQARCNKKKKMAAYVSRSFHWVCLGWMNDLLGLQLPAVAYASIAMILVLAMGVGIGVGYEGLDFHEALYFTVSTVQTSGLAAPKEKPKSEVMCTLLVVVGVPTYAAFCSLLLERIVRPYTTRLRRKMMRHRLASHDNSLLQSIRSNRINSNQRIGFPQGGDTAYGGGGRQQPAAALQEPDMYNGNFVTVSVPREKRGRSASQIRATATTSEGLIWAEYLEVELMRMGILELETLQSVWENFCRLENRSAHAVT